MEEKPEEKHISVLLNELVDSIDIYNDKQNIIVDSTLGMAGHAKHIIKKMTPSDIFVGFDTDIRNLKLAKTILEKINGVKFIENINSLSKDDINIILINSNFVNLKSELEKVGIDKLTGIYYDLGLSSLHIDEADRGFSFRQDGPLDMRFDNTSGKTAADIVNGYLQRDLRQIFVDYGEEPSSTKIAARIVESRKQKRFKTTRDLVDVIEEVNNHPKTKTRVFQAIRIEVNAELDNMKKSISDAIKLLDTDGKIFVISFHSLEDRITKHLFKKETRDCICTDIICSCQHKKSLKILTKKPILPGKKEIIQNPRSRSAKARIAQKI